MHEPCNNCGERWPLNYYRLCDECWDIPEVRHNAEKEDAAERKMEAKETAREDAEYEREHDG